MSTIINVNPIDIISTITSIEIMSIQVSLYNQANFTVSLNDKNGIAVFGRNIIMNSEEYNKWNSDDKFAENFILQKLNMTKISS